MTVDVQINGLVLLQNHMSACLKDGFLDHEERIQVQFSFLSSKIWLSGLLVWVNQTGGPLSVLSILVSTFIVLEAHQVHAMHYYSRVRAIMHLFTSNLHEFFIKNANASEELFVSCTVHDFEHLCACFATCNELSILLFTKKAIYIILWLLLPTINNLCIVVAINVYNS